jgi:hypothetical protein
MIEDRGCDSNLLKVSDDKEADKYKLMFTPSDHMMLRQYECAAEPVVLLSKFFQLAMPHSQLVLLYISKHN